jgi:hypothetical protein
VRRGREVTGVEEMQLGVGQVLEVRARPSGGKNASFWPQGRSVGGVWARCILRAARDKTVTRIG